MSKSVGFTKYLKLGEDKLFYCGTFPKDFCLCPAILLIRAFSIFVYLAF